MDISAVENNRDKQANLLIVGLNVGVKVGEIVGDFVGCRLTIYLKSKS